MAFPLLILSDITPSSPVQPLAATTTLSLMTAQQWHSSALSLMNRPSVRSSAPGSSLTVHKAPALPTAPSARTVVPVKHAQGLNSSSEDDDEPQQLASGGFEGGDTMAAMVIERMERKGAAERPPVICLAHVQGLGRAKQPVTGHLAKLY
jgi:hypothetical protein